MASKAKNKNAKDNQVEPVAEQGLSEVMIANGTTTSGRQQSANETTSPTAVQSVDPAEAKVYGASVRQLRTLMEFRGSEALPELNKKFENVGNLAILLKSNPETGITETPAEIERRRRVFGPNSIPPKKAKPFWRFVLDAIQDPLLIILTVAAVVSLGISFIPMPKEEDENPRNTTHVGPVPAAGSAAFNQLSTQPPHTSNEGCDHNLEWLESVSILLAVALVVFIGSGMDYSKEQEFRKLQSRINSAHMANTIRNAQLTIIPVSELVVGDICLVKYGDLLPADGIIIGSSDLKTDESSLTGESDQVSKASNTDPFLLSGTHVVEGSGRMLVSAVGVNSQAGIIFTLMAQSDYDGADDDDKDKDKPDSAGTDGSAAEEGKSDSKEKKENSSKHRSILQEKLTDLAELIGKIGMAFGIATAVILIIRFLAEKLPVKGWHHNYWLWIVKFFIIGISVLVVAIPEGLPLAVTLALAFSVRKMLADNNMVRHIDSTETMGSATTICSDKTGTLTTNRMTCVRSFFGGHLFEHGSGSPQQDTHSFKVINQHPSKSDFPASVVELLSEGIAVNTSYTSAVEPPSTPTGLPVQKGNKTECALLYYLMRFGVRPEEVRQRHPESSFHKLFTFNSARKFMATCLKKQDGIYFFVKGASERLLERCSTFVDPEGNSKTITPDFRRDMEGTIEGMAGDGLRTLVVAYRKFNADPDWSKEEQLLSDLTLIAITGIEDPVRPEVPEAIRLCRLAGITVRMVTGDNINTARSIAQKCGILVPGDRTGMVIEGRQFNEMVYASDGKVDQAKFDKMWPHLRVLARSSPTDKYTLVNGIIQSRIGTNREVVAVTGDGTNDAPALKRADVGFAMGIAGTDVAKEACDIIITDDNFSSIVKAVMWGRNVYDSVCKFIQFQLTVNVVAVLLAFLGAVFIKHSPLKAIQMLWVNLIMDTLASLALATDAPTEQLLKRPPHQRTAPVISPKMWRFIVGASIYQLTVLFVIMFAGPEFLTFDVEQQCSELNLRVDDDYSKCKSPIDPTMKIQDAECPNVHFTIIFNAFIMMTLANQINARSLHGEHNVFAGLHRNIFFIVIWLIEFGLHVIIIQLAGNVFMTVPLTWEQWVLCLGLGLGQFLWYQLIIFFPIDALWQLAAAGCRRKSATEPTPRSAASLSASVTSLRARHRETVDTQVQDDYAVGSKVHEKLQRQGTRPRLASQGSASIQRVNSQENMQKK